MVGPTIDLDPIGPVTGDELVITFVATAGDNPIQAISYIVSEDNFGTAGPSGTLAVDATTATITGLSMLFSDTYYVRIVAEDTANELGSDIEYFELTAQPLVPPQGSVSYNAPTMDYVLTPGSLQIDSMQWSLSPATGGFIDSGFISNPPNNGSITLPALDQGSYIFYYQLNTQRGGLNDNYPFDVTGDPEPEEDVDHPAPENAGGAPDGEDAIFFGPDGVTPYGPVTDSNGVSWVPSDDSWATTRTYNNGFIETWQVMAFPVLVDGVAVASYLRLDTDSYNGAVVLDYPPPADPDGIYSYAIQPIDGLPDLPELAPIEPDDTDAAEEWA